MRNPTLTLLRVISAAPLLILGLAPNSFAGLSEIWFSESTPSADKISTWNQARASEAAPIYLINTQDPFPRDLARLSSLRGILKLESEKYPTRPSLPMLQSLARNGAEWISLSGDLPAGEELSVLKEAGFQKITFVLHGFTGEEARALNDLAPTVQLSFQAGKFPLYTDKPGLLSVPPSIPLLFIADYWPFYAHMDVMNLLPHPIKLRIVDAAPSAANLDYVRNIRRLEDVAIAHPNPSITVWEALTELPVTWMIRDQLPSLSSVQAFIGSRRTRAASRIRIDSDQSLSPALRAELSASPVPAEWTHRAP